MPSPVTITTSLTLDPQDAAELGEMLPSGHALALDTGPSARLFDFDAVQPADPTQPPIAGWQYSFGIDPATVLVLLFAPLPAIFLKKITEEAAESFWASVKGLFGRLSKKKKGVPLASVQMQFTLETYKNTRIEAVVTYLNARYVSSETWVEMLAACMNGLNDQLAACHAMIDALPQAGPGTASIVIHALIDGSTQQMNIGIAPGQTS